LVATADGPLKNSGEIAPSCQQISHNIRRQTTANVP
jgi:hypothetical protein